MDSSRRRIRSQVHSLGHEPLDREEEKRTERMEDLRADTSHQEGHDRVMPKVSKVHSDNGFIGKGLDDLILL